jgi:AraC-like DNA-binding protein/FixJ family two-component response regulator
MNAVIVEDEKHILNGMREVLAELSEHLNAVMTFDNAEDALEFITRNKPEIVISDIVLPRMSGVDLIERMLTPEYRPKIVIVSGHNDFKYAQRGIKLGVHDYILKPFNNDQFREVVAGMVEAVEKEREDKLRLAPAAYELGTKTLRNNFLHGLCLKPTALQGHVYYRLQFWSLDWMANTDYSVIAIDFARKGKPIAEMEAELRSFAIGNIVEELIDDFMPSVMFKNVMNQWCLIIGRSDIEQVAERLSNKLAAYQKFEVRFGISERMKAFQMLSDAYEQATQALHLCMLNNGAPIQYFSALHPEPRNAIEDITMHIIDCILSMNLKDTEISVHTLLKIFALSGSRSGMSELARNAVEWIADLHTALSAKTESGISPISLELWDQLDRCTGLEEMQLCICGYLSKLAERLSASRTHYLIEQAKKEIQTHFADNITLAGIADKLSIHPVWLSQLFKRECGINFIDYLAEVRIENAKQLLRHSELKIYEIVRAVGYVDVQHFGQLFKKKTGLSPKEFRFGK